MSMATGMEKEGKPTTSTWEQNNTPWESEEAVQPLKTEEPKVAALVPWQTDYKRKRKASVEEETALESSEEAVEDEDEDVVMNDTNYDTDDDDDDDTDDEEVAAKRWNNGLGEPNPSSFRSQFPLTMEGNPTFWCARSGEALDLGCRRAVDLHRGCYC